MCEFEVWHQQLIDKETVQDVTQTTTRRVYMIFGHCSCIYHCCLQRTLVARTTHIRFREMEMDSVTIYVLFGCWKTAFSENYVTFRLSILTISICALISYSFLIITFSKMIIRVMLYICCNVYIYFSIRKWTRHLHSGSLHAMIYRFRPRTIRVIFCKA